MAALIYKRFMNVRRKKVVLDSLGLLLPVAREAVMAALTEAASPWLTGEVQWPPSRWELLAPQHFPGLGPAGGGPAPLPGSAPDAALTESAGSPGQWAGPMQAAAGQLGPPAGGSPPSPFPPVDPGPNPPQAAAPAAPGQAGLPGAPAAGQEPAAWGLGAEEELPVRMEHFTAAMRKVRAHAGPG